MRHRVCLVEHARALRVRQTHGQITTDVEQSGRAEQSQSVREETAPASVEHASPQRLLAGASAVCRSSGLPRSDEDAHVRAVSTSTRRSAPPPCGVHTVVAVTLEDVEDLSLDRWVAHANELSALSAESHRAERDRQSRLGHGAWAVGASD